MTRQEMLNKMVAGMESQNWERSTTADGTKCVYRGENGRKCAVGHLIPDSKYAPAMDMSYGDTSILGIYKDYGLFDHDTAEFLIDFQTAHDEPYSTDERRSEFKRIAKAYGLEWPIKS